MGAGERTTLHSLNSTRTVLPWHREGKMLIYRVIIGIPECINHSSYCTHSTFLLLTGTLKRRWIFFPSLSLSSSVRSAARSFTYIKINVHLCNYSAVAVQS